MGQYIDIKALILFSASGICFFLVIFILSFAKIPSEEKDIYRRGVSGVLVIIILGILHGILNKFLLSVPIGAFVGTIVSIILFPEELRPIQTLYNAIMIQVAHKDWDRNLINLISKDAKEEINKLLNK